MPTKIRLQQHGVRNHPYWWIIVQGPNRNARGRLIEHMGFWIPRKCATVERAIVLNRPRLKYWLGSGAEPSPGVWKILQLANFLPRRPPAFGSATLYERPVKPIHAQQDTLVHRLGAFKNRVEEVRLVEEEIKGTRFEYQGNADEWASFNTKPLPGEMSVDRLGKTREKRDIEEIFDQYANLMKGFDRLVPNATNEQRMSLLSSVMDDEEDELEIINEDELVEKLNITPEQAEELNSIYWSVRQAVTDSDLSDMAENLKFKGKKSLTKGRVYIPSPNTITPVPNFAQDELNEIPRQLGNFRNSLRYEKEFPGDLGIVKKKQKFRVMGGGSGRIHK